jgi:hypothetical protein
VFASLLNKDAMCFVLSAPDMRHQHRVRQYTRNTGQPPIENAMYVF